MGQGGERSGEEESQAAAGARQHARAAMQGHHAEHKKGGDGEEKLGLLERYEAGKQDARGNGSQRRDQRVLHGTPIVAGQWGRMASCAAVADRRWAGPCPAQGRLAIGRRLTICPTTPPTWYNLPMRKTLLLLALASLAFGADTRPKVRAITAFINLDPKASASDVPVQELDGGFSDSR